MMDKLFDSELKQYRKYLTEKQVEKKYKIIDTDSYLTEAPFVIPREKTNTYDDYCKQMLMEEERFKTFISKNL